MVYNITMKIKQNNGEKCNTNPTAKYIRITLSLFVIGLGIYYKNPIGLLGFMTLYTAISGKCGFSIKLNRSKYETKKNIVDNIEVWEPEKD